MLDRNVPIVPSSSPPADLAGGAVEHDELLAGQGGVARRMFSPPFQHHPRSAIHAEDLCSVGLIDIEGMRK